MNTTKPLTVRQLETLATLKANPNASLRELAERMGCAHTSVLQLLQKLQLAGAITADRRITKAGLSALNNAVESFASRLRDAQLGGA